MLQSMKESIELEIEKLQDFLKICQEEKLTDKKITRVNAKLEQLIGEGKKYTDLTHSDLKMLVWWKIRTSQHLGCTLEHYEDSLERIPNELQAGIEKNLSELNYIRKTYYGEEQE